MSVALRIVENIARTLRTINGDQNIISVGASGLLVGSGQTMGPGKFLGPNTSSSVSTPTTYTNTIREAQVIGHAIYQDQIPEDAYPNFSIVFNSETREKEPGRLKKTLQVDIVCAFVQPGAGEVESWLEDIELALAQDVTRGHNAYETWIPSMQRNSDVSEEIQIYIINVECKTLANFGVL